MRRVWASSFSLTPPISRRGALDRSGPRSATSTNNAFAFYAETLVDSGLREVVAAD